ncbi:MAG: hypothetical protein DDT40_00336 [candidate division WS2 bacterium]|nr:hypothetical protein [Candidatus Psychracetigena formicireducens]MBT9137567.1 hypothetical protein [Bacillota bacterium]MBT9150170.1 hypothetical protein [Candidatus Psychracetigena formicireducens]
MMKENDCDTKKNNINQYLDGELDELQIIEFTKHLAECPGCQMALNGFQFIDTALKETPQVEVPLKLKYQVLEAIRRKKLKRSWFLKEKIRVAVFLTAALIITIGLRYALPTWYSSIPAPEKPLAIQEDALSRASIDITPTILEVANMKNTSQELEELFKSFSTVVVESKEIREKEILYYIIVSEKEIDNFIKELARFKEEIETLKAINVTLESGSIYMYIREEKR